MNKPKITDMSTIAIPVRPQYELATKSVKLKDLVNSLSVITFSSDEVKDVKHAYSKIKQSIDIDCSTNALLPDIDSATVVPFLMSWFLPPHTHSTLRFWHPTILFQMTYSISFSIRIPYLPRILVLQLQLPKLRVL